MTDERKLRLLKLDLQLYKTDAYDDYLKRLLAEAEIGLDFDGIRNDGSDAYEYMTLAEAAWRWRNREKNDPEPDYLAFMKHQMRDAQRCRNGL